MRSFKHYLIEKARRFAQGGTLLVFNREEGVIETPAAASNNRTTFILNNRQGSKTIVGRRESVREAKVMSEHGGPTTVKRQDGVVDMTFRSGSLIRYKYEPNKRRR